MDIDGPGVGSRPSQKSVRRVSGDVAADAARRPGRLVHALPAGTSRRGSVDRGHGIERLGRIRSGREPAARAEGAALYLSLIHISEPTRLLSISYAVFCLK